MYSKKYDVEGGKAVTLQLTDEEVQTAKSIVNNSGCKKLFVLKKGKSAPLFFQNELNAFHCMNRNKFDFMFEIDAKEITSFSPKKTVKHD